MMVEIETAVIDSWEMSFSVVVAAMVVVEAFLHIRQKMHYCLMTDPLAVV